MIRVLHVDDEPEFADLTATFLEREHDRLAVETATSVPEALDRLGDTDVDCIVSDYDMPDTNGVEFLERVRDVGSELPFILFTGKGSEEIASEAISTGVTDYLQKGSGTSQYTVLANRITNTVEQYRSKRNFEASQRRLSLLFEQSPLGVIEWNDRFELVRLNETAEEILGYSEDDLRGDSWERIVTESDQGAVADVVADLLEDRGEYHSINENVTKDGERITCEWHNQVVTDDDGDVVAVFSQLQDVTDRRERERELRQTTARLGALFDDSPDMIAIHDTEGNILSSNPRLSERTGYDATELTEMKLWDLDRTTESSEAHRTWEEMGIEDSRRSEGVYERRDGSTFPVEAHVRRLDLDGESRFVVISRDITERKRRERERERAERCRRDINRITTDTDASPGEKIQRLLERGREYLGVENGHVVTIDAEVGSHEIRYATGSDLVASGTETDLSETFCRHTIETDGILDVGDVIASEYEAGPAYEEWGISCYIGAKLIVNDELFGTLCFVDEGTRGSLVSDSEKAIIDLMSRWISHALERKRSRWERELILDRMTDGVVGVDDDWRITYANGRGNELLEAMAGVSRTGDVVAEGRLWDAIPDAEGAEFFERWREAMETHRPVSFRSYYPPLDRWFDGRAYPSPSGLSVYFRDVTEERRREERLTARKRTLREVYDVIADIDLTFEEQVERLIGIGQRVIGTEYGSLSQIDGNDYVFEVVDTPEGTIQPGDVVDLSTTNCERAVLSEETLVLADIAAEAPELAERALCTEQGFSCYIGSPVFRGDEVYGTFCFYDTDARQEPFSEWQVTAVDLIAKWISYELTRERIETRLRDRNEQLEEFASVVSHDLRNPLRVAEGKLRLARGECDSEYLDGVAAAHERMNALIDDLLTLAREGKEMGDAEPVALDELVESCTRNVETGDATVRTLVDRTVHADRDRLTQLVENLLRNAVEHSDSTVTVTVGGVDDGFYVEDDGPGIPESEREEVFEPGYSTIDGGTGFGLRIVKQIAEAHGWEVGITDGPDGGARFEITGVGFAERP